VRVPEEVAQQRREDVRQDARKRGRAVSEKKLELCAWNILVTNAPAELISAYDGWELRRLRWQIDIFHPHCTSSDHLYRCRWAA